MATASMLGCAPLAGNAPPTAVIQWDDWGVPHIFADSEEDIFFADGWAQMHSHANTLLRLYGASRGRGAEYWGKAFLGNDQLVHTLGHVELVRSLQDRQDPRLKALLASFVAGINAYANQHPGAVEPGNQVVLPVTVEDVNLHARFIANTRFLAGRELGMAKHWGQNGSNTIAVAPSRSASGNAMLVQNPHLPWSGEFLFYEKHAVGKGRNIYGANLVGMPGFVIAFNDYLGWSHTNNTIDNADLYELTLREGGYLYAGEVRPFEKHSARLKVKQDDGSLQEQELQIARSVHGPVVGKKGESALALRVVGADRADMLLQWWRMANARDFDSFEASLKMAQIPYWNVMYADRAGNIFYLFNGLVPLRSHGDWAYWQGLVAGDDPANLWDQVHPYADLPRLLNPTTGWLQNANDPPWTSTIPRQINPRDFAPYMSPDEMGFRPQRAARMMLQDDSITFEELIAYKHDTRVELAERLLDDLFAAIEVHGTDLSRQAMDVLQAWDRHADNDSRGAILFQNWARKMNPAKSANFTQDWDAQQPLTTPDGLAAPAAMVRLLDEAANETKARHGRLDVAWGEVNRIEYNGISLPANGAASMLGVFRAAEAGAPENGVQTVRHGDSWVAVIEFGESTRARVLLSYGNSTQPGSAHYGDQLHLFSQKKLRDAWRTEADLAGHVVRTERLHEGRFVPVED